MIIVQNALSVTVTVLQNRFFICTATVSATNHIGSEHVIHPGDAELNQPYYAQNKETLRKWVDPHQLKQIHSTWYKEGRQVVTGGLHDKRSIIRAHHDPPVYGHPGISRTIRLTERHYWWPRMRREIMEFIQGCAQCQRHKINNRPTKAL